MKCPRCQDKVGHVLTGTRKLDYILACFGCSWQVAITALEDWLKKWRA